MFLEKSRKKIEEEFLKYTELFEGKEYPIKEICKKLDECTEDLALAMKYLYVTAPLSDAVNTPFETILDFASHGLFLYNNIESVKNLPEDLYLNYVLAHRVNEEEVLPCRSLFWDILKDRIQDKGQKDAAIEVNYWCAEEATYHSGDARTLPALTVYKRGYGRCGEESVFLVNALRSVGIPARQVYVPRWSHCDDNHAWVELWCDGKWYFTGACEPLMILNKGWFTNASSRAMMVHSRLFDIFPARNENVIDREDAAVTLNQTARYAQVKRVSVKVTDQDDQPVKGAQVLFQILNYGEYFAVARVKTDENGMAALTTGLGTLRVHVFRKGMPGIRIVDMDTRTQDEVKICLDENMTAEEDWKQVDIIAPVDTPVNADMPTPAQKEEGDRRLKKAAQLRREKKENWVNPEKIKFLEKEDPDGLRHAMMEQLSEKDGTDCICSILEEHLEYAKAYEKTMDHDLFVKYILNPRIEDELLRPYRKGILSWLTQEQKAAFCADPVSIWTYIRDAIKEYPKFERKSVMATPYECLRSGFGTNRSKKVLFVAICRTLGIPARLNPDNRVMEYWKEDKFVPVLSEEKGTSVLSIKKEADAVWAYYQHWTIGQLVEGEYVSLDLFNREWKDDQMELSLIPGTYRIITTNRLPNGNQFTWEKTFSIKTGDRREETLRMRKAELGDMLERISLPEFEVKNEDGSVVTCEALTKGNKKILMWLEESCEPTEHILNEMLEHTEEFREFQNQVAFMIRTPEAKEDVLLAKVLRTFPEISVYYDSFEENIELLGRRMYVDPEKLPLIMVTDGASTGIYATSGYNVGTGDMLIRIMREV
jgi:transglutaminase-like putative cysteine protease